MSKNPRANMNWPNPLFIPFKSFQLLQKFFMLGSGSSSREKRVSNGLSHSQAHRVCDYIRLLILPSLRSRMLNSLLVPLVKINIVRGWNFLALDRPRAWIDSEFIDCTLTDGVANQNGLTEVGVDYLGRPGAPHFKWCGREKRKRKGLKRKRREKE